MAYRDFYIKQGTIDFVENVESAASSQGGFYVGSEEWGAYVVELPFGIMPDLKDLPKTEWYDRSGDDEYVPSTPVFKAYEIETTFAIKGKGTLTDISSKVRAFVHYLARAGEFAIYNDYSGVGRQKVRYVGYSDSAQYENDGDDAYIEFKVKLKVNDPITSVVAVKRNGVVIGLGKEGGV